MNPDPKTARQARRKKKLKPGTLDDARALLWQALTRAETMLDAEIVDEDGQRRPDDALALKAIHAISQGAASYARLVNAGEMEERLAALETFTEVGKGPQLGRGAA